MTFLTTKKNVSKFEKDVQENGSYVYTKTKLSSLLANSKISDRIFNSYSFKKKKLIDIGCGDGTYTIEFSNLGIEKILGIDPAKNAIDSANEKAAILGLDELAQFKVGNIYSLNEALSEEIYDCAILRGVLHHLPNAPKAIHHIATVAETIIILEPNGYNPILKLLEKFSAYHIEHEEKSFSPLKLKRWVKEAGFKVETMIFFNLVPFFCPDWMAKFCRRLEPAIERIPILKHLCCGQVIIVATRVYHN